MTWLDERPRCVTIGSVTTLHIESAVKGFEIADLEVARVPNKEFTLCLYFRKDSTLEFA
jgi:hypothetical protein